MEIVFGGLTAWVAGLVLLHPVLHVALGQPDFEIAVGGSVEEIALTEQVEPAFFHGHNSQSPVTIIQCLHDEVAFVVLDIGCELGDIGASVAAVFPSSCVNFCSLFIV